MVGERGEARRVATAEEEEDPRERDPGHVEALREGCVYC